MSRKLASIQRIKDLQPIQGADCIETATVQGWQVVVRKKEFQIGDLCVYFEIDSKLKPEPWCEFLRDRKFQIKTIKLRKQISQGLAVPIDTFCFKKGYVPTVGDDLTDRLGVTKYDTRNKKELREAQVFNCKSTPWRWMLKYSLGRKIHSFLLGKRVRGSWPSWFPKTNEERVQNIPNINDLSVNRQLYMMEKLDGQSATFFYNYNKRSGLFSKGLYGVCSRNIWLCGGDDTQISNWHEVSEEYEIKNKLSNYCRAAEKSLAIQGEIVGSGIQGNPYELEGKQVFFFSAYDITEQRYLTYLEKKRLFKELGLHTVPLLHILPIEKKNSNRNYVELAEGSSVLAPIEREGIVIRDMKDDSFSFKAISNKYLLGQ